MPDLSRLNAKASLLLVANWVVSSGGAKDPKSNAYVMSFVRVVDRIVLDYERARAALIEYVSSPNTLITPLIRATNDCESCISAMIRAINLARRVRGDQKGPQLQRRIRVLSGPVSKKLNAMRNAMEHVDGQIADDAWVPGAPLCLLLKNDGLELAGVEIGYTELAQWVEQLNDLALQLAQYKEPQTNPHS
jgi:hypothetical protein